MLQKKVFFIFGVCNNNLFQLNNSLFQIKKKSMNAFPKQIANILDEVLYIYIFFQI